MPSSIPTGGFAAIPSPGTGSKPYSSIFTCPVQVNEGWGPHSFTEDTSFHCRCQGQSVYELMGLIIVLLDRGDLDAELRSHLRALRKYVEKEKGPAR